MAEQNEEADKASESLTAEVARHLPDMGEEVAHHVPKAAGEVAHHAQGVVDEVATHSQVACDDVVRETPLIIEHLKESLSGLFGGLKDEEPDRK